MELVGETCIYNIIMELSLRQADFDQRTANDENMSVFDLITKNLVLKRGNVAPG